MEVYLWHRTLLPMRGAIRHIASQFTNVHEQTWTGSSMASRPAVTASLALLLLGRSPCQTLHCFGCKRWSIGNPFPFFPILLATKGMSKAKRAQAWERLHSTIDGLHAKHRAFTTRTTRSPGQTSRDLGQSTACHAPTCLEVFCCSFRESRLAIRPDWPGKRHGQLSFLRLSSHIWLCFRTCGKSLRASRHSGTNYTTWTGEPGAWHQRPCQRLSCRNSMAYTAAMLVMRVAACQGAFWDTGLLAQSAGTRLAQIKTDLLCYRSRCLWTLVIKTAFRQTSKVWPWKTGHSARTCQPFGLQKRKENNYNSHSLSLSRKDDLWQTSLRSRDNQVATQELQAFSAQNQVRTANFKHQLTTARFCCTRVPVAHYSGETCLLCL